MRYGLAFVSVACALLLGLTFVHFGLADPFTGFALSAIALTFWQGGTMPGILAVLLAIIIRNCLFGSDVPALSLALHDFTFVVFGSLMIWVTRRRSELEVTVADRTVKLTEAIEELKTEFAERKRAEEDLRASEARFRTLITDAPVAIGMGRNGITRYVNTEYVRLFGLQNPEEAFGRPILDQHAPQCHEQIQDLLRRRQQGLPAPKEYESVGRRKDGSTFPMHVAVSQVELVDGPVSLGFLTDLTERKRAEEALRQSDQRYKDFISHSHEGVWRLELEQPIPLGLPEEEVFARLMHYSYIAECNLAHAHNYGFSTAEEMTGIRLRDLVSHSDQGRLESFRSSIRSGLGSRTVEFQGLDKAGKSKRFLRTEIPIVENGMLVRIWGITRDITELKRAEEELRKLSLAVEQSPATVVITDVQGNIEYVNPKFTQLTGYTPEEARGQNPRILKSGLVPAATYEELWKSVLSGGEWRGEFANKKKNGELYWESASIVPIKDSGGAITHLLAVKEDITGRKRAEEELRLAQFSVEHASDAIFWADSQSRILYVNVAACHSLASSREELLSLTISDIDPLLTREAWEAHWQDLKTRGSMTFESQNKTQDGRVFPVEVASSYMEFGGREYCFAFVHDITKRKRAEEELQRSFDQLRALTARLQSIREEERKRLSREIHDQLGQALTAIKIDLGSLMRELPMEKEQTSIRAGAIFKLVDETIGSVRRISTELRPGMLDDLGLMATVEWAAEEFGTRTGIKCRLDLAEEEVAIDPERATAIFRILQETLTNVARHAGASEVEVRFAVEDGHLTLEVQDNGKGIPPEKLTSGESLGILGMRERAILLGGELTISAFPGNGTMVRVRIPEAART